MIRFIHCMKRKEGVSTEDFRAFWNSAEFNDLVDGIRDLSLTVAVRRNLTLDIDLNRALQAERGAKQPFDGVLEIIWQSGRDLSSLEDNPEFQRLTHAVEELQRQVIDFEESRRFFTEYVDDQA